MNRIEFYGYLGGILNAVIFIPQLYKIYRTKSSKDISWTLIFLSIIASIFSIIYFMEIDAKPVTYTNIFSLFTRILLGMFKLYVEYPFHTKDSILKESLLDSPC